MDDSLLALAALSHTPKLRAEYASMLERASPEGSVKPLIQRLLHECGLPADHSRIRPLVVLLKDASREVSLKVTWDLCCGPMPDFLACSLYVSEYERSSAGPPSAAATQGKACQPHYADPRARTLEQWRELRVTLLAAFARQLLAGAVTPLALCELVLLPLDLVAAAAERYWEEDTLDTLFVRGTHKRSMSAA